MIFVTMCDAVRLMMPKIRHHAFNLELTQGILPQEKFINYLKQDALYLADFSRALALTGARLSNHQHVNQFLTFAVGAINAERELHLKYLEKYSSIKALEMEQNPACFMYTNYLLKMAVLGSVEEAVASLLPCFWIYREIGKQMAESLVSNNPYVDWISMYSSEAFDASVHAAIEIINEIGDSASESVKNKMIAAFVRSTELEWLFWDNAYDLRTWGIYG